MMNSFYKLMCTALITGLLSGCFTGDEGFSSSSTTDTTTATTTTTTASGIQIGNGTGAGFTNGTLAVGLSTLSAGGTTSITANLVDSASAVYSTATDISFASTCSAAGTATLDSPVTTNNGTAISTYTAVGCNGSDTITATATVEGTVLTATATLTVLPATVGSIQFISATPGVIALKGTGGSTVPETSTIIFKVFDSSGGVVANQDVDFTLSTTVGGISLSSATGTTSASGTVQTIVNSGTVNTSVRVTATVSGTTISSQSGALAISTGVPDQNSFAIALSTLNPVAWGFLGVEVDVTAFVADHFNNPAPDGTAVAFQTEGGFIGGSCTTTTGRCTVKWVSAYPFLADARVTILASVIGEEGFTDLNGNGLFDDGEPFTDLAEAYRDDDESGTYLNTSEEFLDYNENTLRDAADTKYNGTLCATASTTCSTTQRLLHVRDQVVLVTAGDATEQLLTVRDITAGLPGILVIDPVGGGTGSIDMPDDRSLVRLQLSIEDARGQLPAAGTGITISTDIGEIKGSDSVLLGTSNAAGPYIMTGSLAAKATETSNTGVFSVEITNTGNAVSGSSTVTYNVPVNLTDTTAPTVASFTPSSGTLGVSVTDAIIVEFSEPMAAGTISAATITSVPAFPGGTLIFYDSSTNSAVILPGGAGLSTPGVNYTVSVSAGATDVAGNALSAVSWIFKTL